MIEHRRLHDIGGSKHGWLKSKHHFAIGHYGNPAHLPVGNLYVWNDDEIAPHAGFPPHNHANVEIVTYVREGVVTHQDDLGNIGHIYAGDVQAMSAGTGIRHSERNEGDTPTRLFQIWLKPNVTGVKPAWDTRPFPKSDRAGRFVFIASASGRDGSLTIRSDAEILGAILTAGTEIDHNIQKGEGAYVVPATGLIQINDIEVPARDGAAIRGECHVRFRALQTAEIVLVVAKAGVNE